MHSIHFVFIYSLIGTTVKAQTYKCYLMYKYTE